MNFTVEYYNKNANEFKNNTINVDFKDRQNMLLKYLKKGNHILDLGCGAGRDSKAFIEKGFKVTSIDASEELCKLASEYIGQQVLCKRFEGLDYKSEFNAIWACASILHVHSNQLPCILEKISKSLKKKGYLYASFKYGDFEGEKNGRHFTYLTEKTLKELIYPFNELKIVEIEITNDVRIEYKNEKWLNIIIQKIKDN